MKRCLYASHFKRLVFACVFVDMKGYCIALVALLAEAHEVLSRNHVMMSDNFRKRYGKVFNGIDGESVRFANFKTNVDTICGDQCQDFDVLVGL